MTAGSDTAFKLSDAASYDPVVASFDRLTERYSAPLARRVVDLARLGGPQRVLDVGTGTGVVALEAARRLERPGGVVGIDLSGEMLARAAEKGAAAGLAPRLDFRRMDAEALALEERRFDAVVSLYALLHFPHPEQALAEMHRVLRPGGRLVVAVGSGPSRRTAKGLVDGVGRVRARLQVQRGTRLEAPHFLDHLVRKHFGEGPNVEESALARTHRNRAAVVPRLVEAAGFAEVRRYWQGYYPEVETAEAFWELQATFSSLARKRLAAARPEAVEALRAEFFATCAAVLERGGRLVYPNAALFVTAVRPAS
ncbi:MAG: methyltransferase domain-containing protein [Rhodothermales bacterium]|nr:methyltransferase domain-containing protein [Rhodothermales bacterium]